MLNRVEPQQTFKTLKVYKNLEKLVCDFEIPFPFYRDINHHLKTNQKLYVTHVYLFVSVINRYIFSGNGGDFLALDL